VPPGRNQNLFSRRDAESAKKEWRTKGWGRKTLQTPAFLAAWRETQFRHSREAGHGPLAHPKRMEMALAGLSARKYWLTQDLSCPMLSAVGLSIEERESRLLHREGPIVTPGRNQNLFSRRDAESAKKEWRTKGWGRKTLQTPAFLAAWRETQFRHSRERGNPCPFTAKYAKHANTAAGRRSVHRLHRFPRIMSWRAQCGNLPSSHEIRATRYEIRRQAAGWRGRFTLYEQRTTRPPAAALPAPCRTNRPSSIIDNQFSLHTIV